MNLKNETVSHDVKCGLCEDVSGCNSCLLGRILIMADSVDSK